MKKSRFFKVALMSAIIFALLIFSGCGPEPVPPESDDTVDESPVLMSPEELNEKHGASVVNVYSDKALGSGVIYKVEDGQAYIITNDHVLREGNKFVVRLSDERQIKAERVGTDIRTDIAVLKVSGNNLQAAKFGDSSKVKTGTAVVAIGNPLGSENSIEDGLISKAEVEEIDFNESNLNKYLQTSASINPGNSGGPLFNMYGEVIGINDMGSTVAQNQNYAIPSNTAKEIADKLIKDGYVSWPYLGIVAKKNDGGGILIERVNKNSPADKQGLKSGDIIAQIDDADVSTVAELREKINARKIGISVSVTYVRKTKQGLKAFNAQVTLEELPRGYTTFDWS